MLEDTVICIPDCPKKRDTKDQKEQKRKKFRRCTAIKPIIGHVKSDHRMQRNYLKGFIEDEINLLLAASAFNLKKWMNNFLFFFMLRIALIVQVLRETKEENMLIFIYFALGCGRIRHSKI